VRRLGAALLGALAWLIAAAAQGAGAWPEQPVHLVVGEGAAGQIVRLLAPALARQLGQPVIIDHRLAATRQLAAPDGYSALVVSNDRELGAAAGWQPVSMLASTPFVILAGTHAGFGSLAGLIEVARHNPDKLFFATAQTGSPQHLAGELFFEMAGIRLRHVAYRDSADAVAATVANETQVLVATAAPVLGALSERMLVPLAVTSAQRYPGLPEVPTVAEAGLPGFRAGSWYALVLPPRTPAPIVQRMRHALHESLEGEKLRRDLAQAAFVPAQGAPQALGAHIAAELARWRALRERLGIE
jgi:tripartite-type tricarboxylate transporter receptor subunit TctC